MINKILLINNFNRKYRIRIFSLKKIKIFENFNKDSKTARIIIINYINIRKFLIDNKDNII